jgi:hypothetical protein
MTASMCPVTNPTPGSDTPYAAAEARKVLRALREGAASLEGDASLVPRRVRVDLPLPPGDMDTDEAGRRKLTHSETVLPIK